MKKLILILSLAIFVPSFFSCEQQNIELTRVEVPLSGLYEHINRVESTLLADGALTRQDVTNITVLVLENRQEILENRRITQAGFLRMEVLIDGIERIIHLGFQEIEIRDEESMLRLMELIDMYNDLKNLLIQYGDNNEDNQQQIIDRLERMEQRQIEICLKLIGLEYRFDAIENRINALIQSLGGIQNFYQLLSQQIAAGNQQILNAITASEQRIIQTVSQLIMMAISHMDDWGTTVTNLISNLPVGDCNIQVGIFNHIESNMDGNSSDDIHIQDIERIFINATGVSCR